MNTKFGSLEEIQIAKPCKMRWEKMTGDERCRHCTACKLNVYNIAEMTREEAMQMIQAAEGRVCLRLHRRFDGTVITKDCPVGVRRVQRRRIGIVAAFILLIGFIKALFCCETEPYILGGI
jgi:hypothetical protein